MREKIKISVRNLVEFVLRAGDLVSSFSGSSRAVEGTKAHQLIQKSYGSEYTPEVTITESIERDDLILEISGRMDGIIKREGTIIIDEIKTTTVPIYEIQEDFNKLHWAQAKCYAYMYVVQNNLEVISIQLTYYQIDTKETKYFIKQYTFLELDAFFQDLVSKYMEWAKVIRQWNLCRNASIEGLKFPFTTYRKGQRELAIGVYRTIKEGKRFFAQAPTGIGKTAATLFPAIKVMGEGGIAKIFYLTAKTITRTVAEKAVGNMKEQGLRCKSLTLTAKDKICFKPGTPCDPMLCEFAKGHFDRVNEAISEIYKVDSFTQECIETIAREYRVCPFELSLDLSLWADLVICDYNYVFDPRVYLKRFFMDTVEEYGFLIDEAHNLVDRAREMFSAELFKKQILDLKGQMKGKSVQLPKVLNKINSYFIQCRKLCEEDGKKFYTQGEPPKELYLLLREFVQLAEQWLMKNKENILQEAVLDLYFKAMGFLRTSEGYDEKYITYFEDTGSDVKIKLFCLDPSNLMQEALKRGKAAVFFSATLTPLDYFLNTLGGNEDTQRIRLTSPFPRENLYLAIEDKISTKYKQREYPYDKITKVIHSVVDGKRGNYLVYFPSYQYMNEVCRKFQEKNENIKVILQEPAMTEGDKDRFLNAFSEENKESVVGFAVMGGIFGEGIDLTGDKLSGAIIIGVGLPQICLERDIIREHFQETKGRGFEYAYIYPGMNKVMQAVGRVIRTEEDRGIVVLVDERFGNREYKNLFPQEWLPTERIKNVTVLQQELIKFWNVENQIKP